MGGGEEGLCTVAFRSWRIRKDWGVRMKRGMRNGHHGMFILQGCRMIWCRGLNMLVRPASLWPSTKTSTS